LCNGTEGTTCIEVVPRGPQEADARRRPRLARRRARAPIDDPQKRLVKRLKRERDEAQELQAASADVLKTISSSPNDLKPVFEAMLAKALRICDAKFGHILLYDGERFHATHLHDVPPSYRAFWEQHGPLRPSPNTGLYRLARTKRVQHIPNLKADSTYAEREPLRVVTVEQAGARSLLCVPMLKESELVGAIVIYRQELRPFREKQIELVQNFAAQAVIAIENARLLKELRQRTEDFAESLQQQTATAEVLKVISRSAFDLQKVFDALTVSACRVCGAYDAVLHLREAEFLFTRSHHGPIPVDYDKIGISRDFVIGRTVADRKTVHVHDLLSELTEFPVGSEMARRMGLRTILGVPLMREQEVVGVLSLRRIEALPFTEKQIALAETFADQAVIAIENARLFEEVQTRTRDLQESLQQQTATADVLKVISRSAFDLQPVLNTLVESASELCNASQGSFYLREGDLFHLATEVGSPPAFVQFLRDNPFSPDRSTGTGRAAASGKVEHLPDVLADPDYRLSEGQRLGGYRSLLSVPLLREGEVIGVFSLTRTEPRAFTERQIELVRTFADQAVIAIQNVRLFEEVQARTSELSESLQQQTATADVLKVISRSTFDLQVVLHTLVESAAKLTDADKATITRQRDGVFYRAESYGFSQEFMACVRTVPVVPERSSAGGRALLEGTVVHIPDVKADQEYTFNEAQRLGDYRAILAVPMLREGSPVGVIVLTRTEPRAFTDKQIELVTTFADQAAIAIENVRLFDQVQTRTQELEESLQQQTATAEVLKVIASSPADVKPVLEAIVESACELCEANDALVVLRDGHDLVFKAQHGLIPIAYERRPIDRQWITGRAVIDCKPIHVHDLLGPEGEEFPRGRELSRRDSTRTVLAVPLLREGESIGAVVLRRTEVHPFSERQIALLQTFANQAVIAIGNVRLFDEVQARTRDLARSVDELTATSDVLKIISRSSVDLETVLDTLAETVTRLCRADQAYLVHHRGDAYHVLAASGLTKEAKDFFLTHPPPIDRGSISGRVVRERRAIHVSDILQDPEFTYRDGQRLAGNRTMLGIPLLREDALIGILIVGRTRVEPFTGKEIELATTFADQAVIAIENARLFEELRDRQAELRVTFDNMGDGVVMFGGDTRLVAWNRNFQTILDLPDAFLAQRPSYADYFRYLVDRGEYSADLEAELSRANEDPWRELRFERTRPDGSVIEVRRNPVPGGGFVLIYADITERKRAEEAVRAARDAAESALRELQTAQASLVHAQKMAALGQLTAGIAHEIKNPLNFVNNFAALSSELTDELSDVLKPVALPGKVREEVKELTGTLKDNLGRVVQHGKRADSIVKNMLLHSREGSGDHRPVEINAIIDESLNLAYHGARAEKQGFNITLERDFDPTVGVADIYPQEVTRVLLNLISNGFYAASQRAGTAGNGFEPRLTAVTRNLGDRVEVRIRDNGMGISADIQEKIFNPFFTTKPAGEGTGLGLSLSHDIVVKQHGGTIEVVTEPGSFTEFIITLPRVMPAQAVPGGQRN
jgi:two-component system, NtrC family, sensor kinase